MSLNKNTSKLSKNQNGKRHKQKIRNQIKELIFKGYRDTKISELTGLPKTVVTGYSKKVRKELEYNGEKATEILHYEYELLKGSLSQRKEILAELLDHETDTKTRLDIVKFLHKLDLDMWKLLGDSEVVLAVKSMKDGRIS